MRIRQRPLPIAAPPSNVAVHRRPPPPPEVYDWRADPEMADDHCLDCGDHLEPCPRHDWLTTALGEPT